MYLGVYALCIPMYEYLFTLHTCMYTIADMQLYTHTNTYMYRIYAHCMYVCKNAYIYICIYTCIYMFVHISLCMHVHIDRCQFQFVWVLWLRFLTTALHPTCKSEAIAVAAIGSPCRREKLCHKLRNTLSLPSVLRRRQGSR